MTKKTFMKKFRNVSDRFYWRVQKDDTLRGYLKGSNSGTWYCPVTAVAKVEKGVSFEDCDVDKASKILGLDNYMPIMTAADESAKVLLRDEREYAPLRRALLKATNPKILNKDGN